MGKDNVPFHTVIFPSTLLATGQDWTLVHHLNTTEYLQYENTKFSKSKNVGVFGNNVMETGIPVDVWRYYLLANRPETSDSQFTWAGIVAANNNELIANLGNFCNRVVKFIASKYKVIPTPGPQTEVDDAFSTSIQQLSAQYTAQMKDVKLRSALKTLMETSSVGNVYLQQNKLDSALFTNNRSRCDTVLFNAVQLMQTLAHMSFPFMPSTAKSILRQLGIDFGDSVAPGSAIGKQEYLFSLFFG